MLLCWQVLLGVSAGAHVVAFAAGLRAAPRYPAWLAMLLLSAWAILTWDPTDPVSPLLYLLLLLRLAAALEAFFWLSDTIPQEARKPLAIAGAALVWVLLFGLSALYAGGTAMQQYLFLRGLIHTGLAVLGLIIVVGLWSPDRHALILSLYLSKFAICQHVAGWLTTTGAWIIVDMASSAANVALLLWWAFWVGRVIPARQGLA